MAPKKTTSKQTVYQLKITLKGIRPPIWRRVQLDSKTKLQDLHMIIQEAMGWDNYHLHSFTIGGYEYGQAGDDFDVRSENNVKLSDVVAGEKSKFFYTYDFGDDWEHEIIVEKELPAAPDAFYPLCMKGKRACPPEDCGGSWGYTELLEIMADPEHPEYEEKMEWFDSDFDPEVFDIDDVNDCLQSLFG
ncbi:MAG: plasmid pRiA4b ORF-3 family protein [Cyanobacteria bacterium J06643_5]